MTWSAVLLAAALLVAPGPASVRRRAGLEIRVPTPAAQGRRADPLAVAAGLDVFAVCLTAGMAVASAAAAAAPASPPQLAALLRRAADLLALGADPATAWSSTGPVDRHGESLLRLARRSAASGAALADGVVELALSVRQEAGESTGWIMRARVEVPGAGSP